MDNHGKILDFRDHNTIRKATANTTEGVETAGSLKTPFFFTF